MEKTNYTTKTTETKMRFITIKDLCELASLKESHVRSLIYRKEIPFVKIGRLIRFNLKEIETYFLENTVKTNQ